MPLIDPSERIAIVGVGGIFPGAPNVETFWQNVSQGIDAGRHVPPGRWFLDAEKACDPVGPKPDRVYSSWGCFIEGFQFDPTGLNLDVDLVTRLDPLFHLGLHAARAAVRDARQISNTDRKRVGVIVGNIALPTESTSAICRDVLGRTLIERLAETLPDTWPRSSEREGSLQTTLQTADWHPKNRLAASLPAELIAQGLGLGGSAYTLDAACASSLYALKFACEELRSFRADAMLAGGMSRPDCQYTQMGFAQLTALSRRGRCAPLSAAADGLVVGEGAGVFVLKRLRDALVHGDQIYGVIAGIGLSNDRGANLLAPHSEGQLRAMRAAYEQAGWRPSDVDLIECHATGTPVGDSVEIASLHQLWHDEDGRPGQCVIGGVKSNVGHLLTGAGAAGLMKVLFAIKHKTLPPTANYEQPAPSIDPEISPFRVLAKAEAWLQRGRTTATNNQSAPRRATVNAFGFGGINAHVLVEEFEAAPHSAGGVAAPRSLNLDKISRVTPTAAIPATQQELNIAVVGLASVSADDNPTDQTGDWGVKTSRWFQRELNTHLHNSPIAVRSIQNVRIPFGAFRIPPLELQDMLPQQQLMLNAADAALRDVRRSADATRIDSGSSNDELNIRTGVFIGIELDPNTTNFHLRWSIEQLAPTWARTLGLNLTPAELTLWIEQLKQSVSPPLNSNRVMGNLGGIVASRLAREFNVGGPSFTISSDENSGLRACEMAAHALRRGELDRALVGAVDLPCDVRSVVERLRDPSEVTQQPVRDGATALVLKRLEDAIRDRDQIHAVMTRIHSERHGESAADNQYVSTGAATGLLQLTNSISEISDQVRRHPNRRFWLRNRGQESRQRSVAGYGIDGRTVQVDLSEAPSTSKQGGAATLSEAVAGLPAQLFVVDGNSIDEILAALRQLTNHSSTSSSIEDLARGWFRQRTPSTERSLGMTLLVKDTRELIEVLTVAEQRLRGTNRPDRRVQMSPRPLAQTGRMAFVFPGSGNAFLGMGRELFATFPEILRAQDAENLSLKDQYRPDLIWDGESTATLLDDHKSMIFGQVALGTAVCDLLARFGIRPTASVGYSLGESAALFGLRAWTDRDEMLQRMHDATLFGSDLVKPFNATRRAWNTPPGESVDWISGVVDRSADAIRSALAAANTSGRFSKVYLLIVNTPTQCVIGGDRREVDELIRQLAATFVPFAAPSTVHCEVLRQVEPAYRALHLMRTAQPPGSAIDFYSTAWGRPYDLTRESAAEAIVAQAVETIDFPNVVERAYADGVRLFVEIGPGSSCTKMIDEILGERPHFARSATPITANPVTAFLELIAVLIAERVPLDLSALYGKTKREAELPQVTTDRFVETPVGGTPFQIPLPPHGWPKVPPHIQESVSASNGHANGANHKAVAVVRKPFESRTTDTVTATPPASTQRRATDGGAERNQAESAPVSVSSVESIKKTQHKRPVKAGIHGTNVMTEWEEMLAARMTAHGTYLRVSAEAQRLVAEQLALLDAELSVVSGSSIESDADEIVTTSEPTTDQFRPNERKSLQQEPLTQVSTDPPRSLSRAQCMEFAIGKIGRALGQTFAEIDAHPTRVRLPDEPLMLVDRILEIDGEPLSMTSGRVVTEHDIRPDSWYLDCNRIPTCIAVEAGQADLFLSGWLGIDLQTKGLACYRLLDAVVTFHRELPQPGRMIHYDIRINHFFRQGQTYLFRFEFDATVDGQPLLTMREGCAGFFTEAELASGKGIVHTALDRAPRPGKRPADWIDPVPLTTEQYSDDQLLALRRGDLAGCFGPAFSHLPLANPVTLPGLVGLSANAPEGRSKMWLVDRILKLDPTAGKFGMGMILGELDIRPDDWFLTCHFCDDQVMPGTLMYECCLHTLRVYLLRMGWIGETDQVVYEPIPGVRSRLKCRGQVRANTKKVWYEITLKEVGYRTEDNAAPYCLADALMYADGKPIVEITDMSVRLSGLTREMIERLWSSRAVSAHVTPAVQYDRRPALFDTDRITAFAIGKPSEAFGERYRVFDTDRMIARLPGPPFQFLDRIVDIQGCQPWELKPGGEIVAQYDVPPDAWYFAANRQQRMPFAVLLETALQPCGWLAAYVGSALTSDLDLSFRNLGGTAAQYADVTPLSGTLTTAVKMTRVSNSGGMIIQHYDFDLRCNGRPVYVGNTYFGFFSKASLANQIGIRDAKPFIPNSHEVAKSFAYPDRPPFADRRFQMIDDVQISLTGGPKENGFAVGTMQVNSSAWFFKAHFYQDPVVPGSLGLESFFQLLKLYAAERWNLTGDSEFTTPVIDGQSTSVGSKHEWVYRGQVIPKDKLVTVSAVISKVDDQACELTAEGFLSVDGRVIYQMKEFSLGLGTLR